MTRAVSILMGALAVCACSSDGGAGRSRDADGGDGASASTASGGASGQGMGGGSGQGTGATGDAGTGTQAGRSGSGGTTLGGSGSGGSAGSSSGSGRGGRSGRGGSGGLASGACAGQSSGAGAGQSSSGGDAASGTGGSGGSGSTSTTGWLHTKGNKIYRDDETVWMGRGANVDDVYLCGYNYMLTESNIEQTLENIADGLITTWNANFIRVMLAMASYPTTSTFVTSNSQYKTPMTKFIDSIGAHPNVYILVTLRSDESMIGQDQDDGDPEATGLPSDATTTPDKTKFPTGTDAAYTALVDAFANSSFVMFGITNEPGGNQLPNSTIQAAMSHAVDVIRAEEDKLGVPHHIVSVQGQGWTSDISFYGKKPLTQDNVVYEVHGYPPTTSSYTYANIPVILGEYGTLSNATSFFSDLETKQISNLAFSFSPYSDCDPDLLQVNDSSTELSPTAWGTTVKNYLTSHAP